MEKRKIYLLKFLGNKIRMRRYDCNITQMELAELVGCSLNSIGEIERGKANPSIFMVYLISKSLDINVKDLLPEKNFEL